MLLKRINDVMGVDRSYLAAKRDIIALKTEVEKLDFK